MRRVAWCIAIALAGGGSLVAAGCGGDSGKPAQTTSRATAVLPVSKFDVTGPFRSRQTLAAFKRERVGKDAIPKALIKDAYLASGGRKTLGRPDIQGSRLLIRAARLYAWPVGEDGICLGIPRRIADCRRGFPTAQPALPFAIVNGTSGEAPVLIGMVEDEVIRMRIRFGSGKKCDALVQNNGFYCSLPQYEDGDYVRSLEAVVRGKNKTVKIR